MMHNILSPSLRGIHTKSAIHADVFKCFTTPLHDAQYTESKFLGSHTHFAISADKF